MIVLVYGYDGSGPGHWQRWLHGELLRREVPVVFPELSDPLQPDKDRWVAELAEVVAAAPTPVRFIAHSLGSWAVDHYLHERGSVGVAGALLVAPPSPYLFFDPVETFLPPPRDRAAWAPIADRSLIVASDNDDFATAEEVEEIAIQLGLRFELLQGAGHINPASGHGPLPIALEWAGGSTDPTGG